MGFLVVDTNSKALKWKFRFANVRYYTILYLDLNLLQSVKVQPTYFVGMHSYGCSCCSIGNYFFVGVHIFSNHWMQQFSYTHKSHTFQQRVLFFLLYAQMTTLHLTVGYMYVWSHVLFAPNCNSSWSLQLVLNFSCNI